MKVSFVEDDDPALPYGGEKYWRLIIDDACQMSGWIKPEHGRRLKVLFEAGNVDGDDRIDLVHKSAMNFALSLMDVLKGGAK